MQISVSDVWMWCLHLTHPQFLWPVIHYNLALGWTQRKDSWGSGQQMITGWTQLGQDPWARCCLYAEDGMKELVPEAWDLLVEDAN